MDDNIRQETDISTEIRKYYLYQFASGNGFAAPFLILFLLGQGIGFTEIALGGSAMSIVMLVMEVPSGYLGDKFGRRTSLLLGQTLLALGTTGYLFIQGAVGIALVYSLLGFAAAFRSGSKSAWLYDILGEADIEDRFTDIQGRGRAIANWAAAGTMLVGAPLFIIGPGLPISAAAGMQWLALVILYTFPHNVQYERDDSGSELTFGKAIDVITEVLPQDGVRPLVMLGALYAAALYTASDYVQPAVAGSIPQSGMKVLGILVPEAAILAVLYSVLSVSTGTMMNYADTLKQRLGIGQSITAVYSIGSFAMVLPLFFPLLTLLSVFIFRSLPPVAAPIRNGYINDQSESIGRATILSTISLVFAVVRVPVLLSGGVIADYFSAEFALAAVGGFTLIGIFSVTLFDSPFSAGKK